MTTINNDLKKVLRGKYNIHNITISRSKSGFTDTNDYYKYLYELYLKDKQKELEQLKEKERKEIELQDKLDKQNKKIN